MAERPGRTTEDAATSVMLCATETAEADNRLGVLVMPAAFDAIAGNAVPHMDLSRMSGVCRDETAWYARESGPPQLLHVPAHVTWEGWGIVRYDNCGERHNACVRDFGPQQAYTKPLAPSFTNSEFPHFIQAKKRTAVKFPAAGGTVFPRNAAALMSDRLNDYAGATLNGIPADSDTVNLDTGSGGIGFSRGALTFARSPNLAARMKGITARHSAINPDAAIKKHECRCFGQTSRVRSTSQGRLAQWWPSAQIFSRCSTEPYEGGVES